VSCNVYGVTAGGTGNKDDTGRRVRPGREGCFREPPQVAGLEAARAVNPRCRSPRPGALQACPNVC
jgi:hypothetical protein